MGKRFDRADGICYNCVRSFKKEAPWTRCARAMIAREKGLAAYVLMQTAYKPLEEKSKEHS